MASSTKRIQWQEKVTPQPTQIAMVALSPMFACQMQMMPAAGAQWMYAMAYQQAAAEVRSWRWSRRMEPGLN